MKSPAHFRRTLLVLAVPTMLVGCADSILSPEVGSRSTGHAPRTLADPTGGCAAIAAAHPGSPDGDYAASGAGGATFKVYCHNMASAPATYLSLPISGPASGKNFGSWGGEYQHLWENHVIETYYSKARFNPATLQVDNNDTTFSETVGFRAFGPGAYLYYMPFANAGDCLGGGASGRANVDLNGTPFSLDEIFITEGWGPSGEVNGEFNGWDEQKLVTGKTADLRGGGFCGGTNPFRNRGFTQLAFTGPGLSSPVVTLSATTELIEGATTAVLSASASHPDAVPFWTHWSLGDGTTGTGALPATHTYASTPGTYTVSFTAYDEATTPTTVSQTVTVISRASAAQALAQLVSANMPAQDAKPLIVSLEAFIASLGRGNMNSAAGQLGAFDNKLSAALHAGKISAETYALLSAASQRIRFALSSRV